MSLHNAIFKFLGIFVIVYVVLLLLPGLGQGYAAFHRSVGDALFSEFGEKGIVEFEAYKSEEEPEFRTMLKLFNRAAYERSQRTGEAVQHAFVYSSWYTDYLIITLFIALLVASPIGWKRKGWALLIGIVLINLYILFIQYIALLYNFNYYEVLGVLSLSEFWEGLVNFLHPILLLNPGTGIFVAFTTWLLVTFNRVDYQELMLVLRQKA